MHCQPQHRGSSLEIFYIKITTGYVCVRVCAFAQYFLEYCVTCILSTQLPLDLGMVGPSRL